MSRSTPSKRARSYAHASSKPGAIPHSSVLLLLLLASFGILFAGCGTPSAEQKQEDEFTFTEDDLERFRELSNSADDELAAMRGSGSSLSAAPRLAGTGAATSVAKVADPALVSHYKAIRSGLSANGGTYRVSNTFVNVRSEPKTTAAEVGRLNQGEAVNVTEFVDGSWAKVQLKDGKPGYVVVRYLSKLTSEDRLATEKKAFENMYYVDFAFLNVRESPNAQSAKIGELPGQSFVKPKSIDGDWARVEISGKEGFVSSQYLEPFMPTFLVRQERFELPILHYKLSQQGIVPVLVAHVNALRKDGFKVITITDFANLLEQQEQKDVRLDPKTVIIAVSDITPSNLDSATDALAGIRATLFLQTQHVGMHGITEKKIATLIANGFDLQSAGHTGDDLRSLTTSQVELELAQSRQLLEQYTGKKITAVAYPWGGVNQRVMDLAANAGYLMGMGTTPGRTFTREQLLALPSAEMNALSSEEDVRRLVTQ